MDQPSKTPEQTKFDNTMAAEQAKLAADIAASEQDKRTLDATEQAEAERLKAVPDATGATAQKDRFEHDVDAEFDENGLQKAKHITLDHSQEK